MAVVLALQVSTAAIESAPPAYQPPRQQFDWVGPANQFKDCLSRHPHSLPLLSEPHTYNGMGMIRRAAGSQLQFALTDRQSVYK